MMNQPPFDVGREAFQLGDAQLQNPFDYDDDPEEHAAWNTGWLAAQAEADAIANHPATSLNLAYLEMLVHEAEQQGRHDGQASLALKQLLQSATILIEVEAGLVQNVYANRGDVTVSVYDADEDSRIETEACEEKRVGMVEVY